MGIFVRAPSQSRKIFFFPLFLPLSLFFSLSLPTAFLYSSFILDPGKQDSNVLIVPQNSWLLNTHASSSLQPNTNSALAVGRFLKMNISKPWPLNQRDYLGVLYLLSWPLTPGSRVSRKIQSKLMGFDAGNLTVLAWRGGRHVAKQAVACSSWEHTSQTDVRKSQTVFLQPSGTESCLLKWIPWF